MKQQFRHALLLGILLIASTRVTAQEATGTSAIYALEGGEGLLGRFAPLFIVEDIEQSFNKIGTPAARTHRDGKEEVFVDTSHASIYTDSQTFQTDEDTYTNLIYRVHFERNPFTLLPLNVGAGKNVGAIAIITLNGREEPVWLTTVQSCGCYHAIIPTDYLSKEHYPEDWDPDGVEVYGEQLPGLLAMKDAPPDARIAITLRSGNHRTKGVSVGSVESLGEASSVISAVSVPVEALKALKLPDGSETSFYHTEGWRKGLVKGAHKPLETMLFGLWAWDHNVGQDREYGSKEEAGRRFYTTLFFKRKKDSDMWHFARYLAHNGWKP